MEWIEEHPDVAGLAEQHRTRSSPRRSHTKSRFGCQPCKVRRIKCDEERPVCSQCQTRNSECKYPTVADRQSKLRHAKNSSPKEGTTDSEGDVELLKEQSTVDYRAQLLQYLRMANVPRQEYLTPVYAQEDNEEILDHFLTCEEPWIGPPELQKTMQKHGSRLAASAPYLLHGIMAYSASHLYHCNPMVKKYEIAQTVNFALSLQTFTAQLRLPITPDNADALFGCAFLHSMLAFWQQAREGNDDEPFRWLITCRGVPTLQSAGVIRARITDSVWYDAFVTAIGLARTDVAPKVHPTVEAWARTTMAKFERLCTVSLDNDNEESSVYVGPLRQLNKLLRMKIDHRATGAMMIFNGRLSTAFVELLESGDKRAMMMFSYWYALMCNLKQWWTETQAMKECRRICHYLMNVDDDLVRDLLEWPMHQCGLIVSPSMSHSSTDSPRQ